MLTKIKTPGFPGVKCKTPKVAKISKMKTPGFRRLKLAGEPRGLGSSKNPLQSLVQVLPALIAGITCYISVYYLLLACMEQVIYRNYLHFTRTSPHHICSAQSRTKLQREQYIVVLCLQIGSHTVTSLNQLLFRLLDLRH